MRPKTKYLQERKRAQRPPATTAKKPETAAERNALCYARKRKALSESVSSAMAPSTETPSSSDDGILQKLDKFKGASLC